MNSFNIFIIRGGNVKENNKLLDKKNIENIMSLTSLQEGILFHYISDEESNVYHEQISLIIKGDIKLELFQRAWQFVIDNNEMLRTVFRWKGIEKPVQIVLKKHEILIKYYDFTNKVDKNGEIEKIKLLDLDNRIDILNETLRIYLCKLDEQEYEMIISNHHILYDGWSNGIILKELMDTYSSLYNEKQFKKINKTKFSEFVKYSKLVDENKNKSFWKKYLDEYEINNLFSRNLSDSKENGNFAHCFSKNITEKLKKFGKDNKVSLASILYTSWGIILQKLNNKRDVVFGTIVSGRNPQIKDIDKMVGLFINTIPIRLRSSLNENLLELIRNTDSSIKERNEFENSSLIDINKYCNLKQNESLFNTIVGIENYPIDFNENNNILSIESVSADSRTNYDLTLEIRTFNNIELHFNYNSNVISDNVIKRLCGYFEKVILAILSNCNDKINDIEIISEEEKNILLHVFNNTFLEYPKDKTIKDLFEIQSHKTPDNIAVVCDNNKLTYKALNDKANKLARTLVKQGVKANSIVGIMVEPSIDMIIGIMGILKVGGAYLPISTDYPNERIEYILSNSEANILLTHSKIKNRINTKVNILELDDETIYEDECANLELKFTPRNLSYVIYTSGTTGYPKGVLVEHRNVINLVYGLNKDIYSRYGENLNVALVAPYVFDASVQQIFASLLFGHTLFIVPKDARKDGKLLLKYYNENLIDISDGTPVHINMLTSAKVGNEIKVKHFIIGGDTLSYKLAQNFYKKYNAGNINFTNVYGPTECCVDSTLYHFNRDTLSKRTFIPIGKPNYNECIYILGENLELLPIGSSGEIYISGDGVSRGYLNNDKLNKERFINNPFNTKQLFYKTGDFGRWTESGEIEFLGRKDHQVKIRGFRIELGEIENKLLDFSKNKALSEKEEDDNVQYCSKCLLTSNYPNIHFNKNGVCNYCESYETYKEKANKYFDNISGFSKIVEKSKRNKKGEYDCLLLYSGGKDSSYVLYRLVEMGLKVLAFTFDNGYISDTAFENIKRITTKLNVDSIICNSENMDEIFLDSLKNDSTVCTGCFKALTAMSTKIAYDKGINLVITGLSRGQIFDTKLQGIFEQGIFEIDEVEKRLLLLRKMYHSIDDRTAELLNINLKEEKFFDETYFVDFFRYENISSNDIKEYLKKKDEFWSLPGDTGFCSTNCLINDVGIYVHLKNKKYHNYAAPLSWDCRLGQLTREAGLAELQPIINEQKVNTILDKIGYNFAKNNDKSIKKVVVLDREDTNSNKYLCAYFVSDERLTVSELREYLSAELPEYMIPSYFIRVNDIPITINGKVDRKALIKEKDILRDNKKYINPRNEIEEKLQKIWNEILGIEKISMNENFFELGGHSLNAMSLLTKIHKEFNVEIPIKQLFISSTIEELGKYIESAEENPYSNIEKIGEKEYYETSSAQKRMYMLQQFDKDSTAYNIPAVFELEGKIDNKKIEDTFRKLIKRHEALRTYFETINGKITQKIQKDYQFNLSCTITSENIEDIINKFIRPFDLGNVALFRVKLIVNNEKTYLLIDMHHIISDGVSISNLINDFARLYNGENLDPLKLQYKDFAAWQNNFLQSEKIKKQEKYWIDLFSDEIPILNMPTDYERTATQSFDGDSVSFEVDEDLTLKLRKLTKETGTTMHMVLLSAFNILLSRYSGQEDIVIGVPVAGRPHEDLQNIMGMFVNTLALRNSPKGDKKYIDFLREVKENCLKAYENQSYQLETLIEKLDVRRDTSRNPLFDVMFNMSEEETNVDIKLDDVVLKASVASNKVSKFDLTLNAVETNTKINFSIDYCVKLFKKEKVERLSSHYVRILESIVDSAEIKLKEVELLPEAEKNKILYDFNNTKAEYPKHKTIKELFEEQVARTPENVAVIFEGHRLTYRQVNEKANKLAKYLSTNGVKPNEIVAIMVERSFEMVVGILGILKAGGAYLPIDPQYPSERIKYIIEDSNTKILLTQTKFNDSIVFNGKKIDLENKDFYKGSGENLPNVACEHDLAYIIYTSGSTGNPKGVMIENYSLVNRLNWMQRKYPINSNDVILQKTTYTFDVSVWELIWWSLVGAKVYMLQPGKEKDPKSIIDAIEKNKITTIHFVPSMFNIFLEYISEIKQIEKLKTLKQIFTSGESLGIQHVNSFKNHIYSKYKINLINLYGPTEATIDVTYFDCLKEDFTECVPIGRPIDNTRLYIIGVNNEIQPLGIPGELCIAGDGLARGYLNKAELTKEKFIENPFEIGGKLYRTGDLVRWLPNGNIEFLGRIDNQVKIRGFRIEIGEIENRLLNYERIKQAIVIDKKDEFEDKYLCAYIVGDKRLSSAEVKNHLRKFLPDYMVPSYIVQLQEMPLTLNGKINRRALPEPEKEDEVVTEFEAPRNKIEQILVKIWSDVLEINNISIGDNFFNLGGDSIKAIRVVSKLHQYGYDLEIKDLFKYLSIKEVSSKVFVVNKSISQAEVEGDVKLSPIQKWFFEKQFQDIHYWNQALMIFNKNRFNEDIIKQVFNKLFEHHDALRICFKEENGSVKQFNKNVSGEYCDLKVFNFIGENDCANKIEKECNVIHSSIDLNNGPLVKLGLFKTNDGDHLLISIHHLIIDGVSWRILLEDFADAYKKIVQGKDVVFPDKTNSYKEWTEFLEQYSNCKEIHKQLEYWNALENEKCDELLKDKQHLTTKNILSNCKRVSIKLSKDDTRLLLNSSNSAYNTEINDLLLTGLGLTIKEWTGNDNVIVNLEGHGREKLSSNMDISRTIGWFTSIYPVKLDMKDCNEIGNAIKNTKEMLRKVPNKGIGYGILKYLSNNKIEGKINPEIGFNYLGEFGREINNELFKISNLSFGNTRSLSSENIYLLDINAVILNGELNINLDYNKEIYREDTMINVGEIYKYNLCKIIKHCSDQLESSLTPYDVGDVNLTVNELDKLVQKCKEYGNFKIKNVYSLTPMQKGMLYYFLKDNNSTAYFQQIIFNIDGDINLDCLNKSFNKLIDKNDILKTIFAYDDLTEPKQIVLAERRSNICYKDISMLDRDKINEYLLEFEEKDKLRGFDLSKDLLVRISLLKIGIGKYKMIFNYHHIILDGWSLGIIINDLINIYHGLLENENFKEANTDQYINFVNWIYNQDQDEAKVFWENYLEEYQVKETITSIGEKLCKKEYDLKEVKFKVNNELTKKLTQISKKEQVTLNSIMQSVWAIILQKYSNSNDIVFGSVVSGRNTNVKDIDKMVGLFINTIPVRAKIDKHLDFIQLAKIMQQNLLVQSKYDYYSLADIQSYAGIKEGLIDNLYVFENYYFDESIKDTNLKSRVGFNITDIETYEETNYNLNIKVNPGEEIGINLSYNAKMFDEYMIRNISNQILQIINTITKNYNIDISKINILSQKEKDDLLSKFNNTKTEFIKSKTMQELFEMQVNKTPNNVAVVNENQKLTYKELNYRANQLARTLRKKGVKPNNLVGIMAERSLDLIIGIMGILKAGGAYLPIDTKYPEERIRYIVKDSKINILITQSKLLKEIKFEGEIIDLDNESVYDQDNSNLNNVNLSKDLAYTIYTSGSTGKPKGVMIKHESAINTIQDINNKFNVRDEDGIIGISSVCFDLSVYDIFGSLSCGATLIQIKDQRDIRQVLNVLESKNVTIWNSVPIIMDLLIESMPSNFKNDRVRVILLSGDYMPLNLPEKIMKHFPRAKIINLGGNTEASIWTAYYQIKKVNPNWKSIPYGVPLSNQSIYVLDKDMNLCPYGVAGELYFGGFGLAKGYINDIEKTKKSFITHSEFGNLYKTGDWGKFHKDGYIEFLGRKDHQIKIRGYRIELGEIESQILSINEVKDVIVIGKTDQNRNQYLCAYVVASEGINTSEIRKYLTKKLPDYMIPMYFITLDKLPLSPNGKVDRKALPEPSEPITSDYEYVAPRNDIEMKLAKIFEEVLGIQKIGIHDNFFMLGGHSLKAMIASRKVYNELNFNMPVSTFFERPTIYELYEYMMDSITKKYPEIIKNEDKNMYLTTAAQNRMYILQHMTRGNKNYNITIPMRIEGEIDEIKLEKAFKDLVRRHEVLRTHFEFSNNNLVQIVEDEIDFKINYQNVNDLDFYDQKRVNEIIRSYTVEFNLNVGPLFNVTLVKITEKQHLLIIDMHHIISDGMSIKILLNDFIQLYSGKKLCANKLQYKDYAQWENDRVNSKEFYEMERFWKYYLGGKIPKLKLSYDYPVVNKQMINGECIQISLDREIVLSLKKICKLTGNTMYTVLLSIFSIVISKASKQDEVLIGTPVSGRDNPEVEQIVGMFVNTILVNTKPQADKSFLEYLLELNKDIIKLHKYSEYPFDRLVNKLYSMQGEKDSIINAMFTVDQYPESIKLGKFELIPVLFDNGFAKFDMTMTAFECKNETIIIHLNYCTDLFKKSSMELLLNNYKNIINQIIKELDIKIKDIVIEDKDNLSIKPNDNIGIRDIEFNF